MWDRLAAGWRKLPGLARAPAVVCWAVALFLLAYAWRGTEVPGDRLAAVTAGGTLALAGSALLAWLESRALVSETRNLVKATKEQAAAAMEALSLSMTPHVTPSSGLSDGENATWIVLQCSNSGPGVAVAVHAAIAAFRHEQWRFWSSEGVGRQLGSGEATAWTPAEARSPGVQTWRVLTDGVDAYGLHLDSGVIAVGYGDLLGRRYRVVVDDQGARHDDYWKPGEIEPEWAQTWPK